MNDSASVDDGLPPKRRGGRKPGSKNKPKGEALQVMPAQDDLRSEIQALRQAVQQACELLKQAMALRVGMFDSESRAHDIQKQRAQLEQEAHERLRSML